MVAMVTVGIIFAPVVAMGGGHMLTSSAGAPYVNDFYDLDIMANFSKL